jgi:cobalt-zinc-cadmium efflux system outer membrane protein
MRRPADQELAMPIAPFNRYALPLLSLALLPVAGAAQSAPVVRLSLSDAIAAAWTASADARAADYALAAAAGRTRQAGARPNPILSYGREQTSADGFGTSQDILALEQRIEPGGYRSARITAARAREQAADARLAVVRSQVAYEATRAYAMALAAQQRVRLANQAGDIFTRAVNVSSRQLAAGDVSGYANRRIRLEAVRYATVRAADQLEARTTALALSALVSGAPDSIVVRQFALTDSLTLTTASLPSTADSLVTIALRNRGDLKAMEYELAAAQADARGASAGRTPVPAVTLGFKRERSIESDVAARGFVLGVSIPAPLWDRRSGEIAASTAEAGRRSAELVSMRRRIAREVIEAYESWRAAELALQPLREELGESSARSLNAVQVAWLEGEITLVEWLDTVRAYQEAEATAITLRAQAMVRRAALDHALGLAGPISAGTDLPNRSSR